MTQTFEVEIVDHKGDITVSNNIVTVVPPCFKWMRGMDIHHLRIWVKQRKGKLHKKEQHA